MALASNNEFPSLLIKEGSTPASPAAGDQRLFLDSSTHHLKRVNSSGVVVDVEAGGGTPAALASASYLRTSGDYTTSSTSFVDIDGTNTNFSITTGAHRVLIGCVGVAANTSGVADSIVAFDCAVDGTRLGGTFGMNWIRQQSNQSDEEPFGFTYLTDALTAAAHTFHFQWRVSSSSAKIVGAANTYARFYVCELYA